MEVLISMKSTILEENYKDYEYSYSCGSIGIFKHKTKNDNFLFLSKLNQIEIFQITESPDLIAKELDHKSLNKEPFRITFFSNQHKETKEKTMKNNFGFIGYILCLFLIAEALVHFTA